MSVFKGQWKESLFQKGDFKYVILDLINNKPRHGYEIIRSIEELSHGIYKPSTGAVYPALQTLAKSGYVTMADVGGKKIYTITVKGEEFITKRKDFTEEIKNSMKCSWNPDNLLEISKTIDELDRLRNLFNYRLRYLSNEGMQRIRKIISRAYEDIDEIVKECD